MECDVLISKTTCAVNLICTFSLLSCIPTVPPSQVAAASQTSVHSSVSASNIPLSPPETPNPTSVPTRESNFPEPILLEPNSSESTEPQNSTTQPTPMPSPSFLNTGSRSSGSGEFPSIPVVTPEPTPVPTPLPTAPPVLSETNLENGNIFGTAGLVLSSNGTVFAPAKTGLIQAFKEGAEVWAKDLGTEIATQPTLGPDGTLFVSGVNGSVYALDGNGNILWTFTPPEPNSFRLGGMALDENGVLYTGGTFGIVYAIDTQNGSEVWRFKARAPIDNTPVVSSNRVYVLALDQTLYSLQRSSGEYIWEFQTGLPISNLVSAVNSQEEIIFGSEDPWLYSVEKEGFENWSYVMESALSASPVIDALQNTYAPTADGKLYSVDFEGDLNWVYNTQAPILASPVIGDNNEIYVGNKEGKLFAIGLDSGTINWQKDLGAKITGKLLMDDTGKLYVTLDTGKILSFQTGSTAPAGEWPMQQKQIEGWGRL